MEDCLDRSLKLAAIDCTLHIIVYYVTSLCRIKGLGRTGVIEKIPVQEDSIDIGHDLTLVSMGSMDDTRREQRLEPLEDSTKQPMGNGTLCMLYHNNTSPQ